MAIRFLQKILYPRLAPDDEVAAATPLVVALPAEDSALPVEVVAAEALAELDDEEVEVEDEVEDDEEDEVEFPLEDNPYS